MIAYGYSVKGKDDPLVNVVEAAMHGFSECMKPSAFLVDMIPLRESPFLPTALLGISTSSSLHDQCDTSRIGSLERDGK